MSGDCRVCRVQGVFSVGLSRVRDSWGDVITARRVRHQRTGLLDRIASSAA